jgi:tetratricopeptide (TPR) repeat protein
MKNTIVTFFLFLALLFVSSVSAQKLVQTQAVSSGSPHDVYVATLAGTPPQTQACIGIASAGDCNWCVSIEDPGDSSFSLCKQGYNLILDEKWDAARRKFAHILKKYPKSKCVDYAAYWSAYALMHIDERKAIDFYQQFIQGYPKSSYYDDAVADLNKLEAARSLDSVRTTREHAYGGNIGRTYNTGIPYSQASKHYQMAVGPGVYLPGKDDELDPETHLKIEALYALSLKEDEKSFQTLKDVALDRGQPLRLREIAMAQLSRFEKFDPLPVFLDVAAKDTSANLQNSAIFFIGQSRRNKDRSMETLIKLFNAVPKTQNEQLGKVLFSIAEVGGDKAVDFLVNVAKTHQNYDLRRNAVFCLGNIGGDKARSALSEILKKK